MFILLRYAFAADIRGTVFSISAPQSILVILRAIRRCVSRHEVGGLTKRVFELFRTKQCQEVSDILEADGIA